MPIPEFQVQIAHTEIARFMQNRRPRPEIRHQLDLKAEIEGSIVTLFEVRPHYQDPSIIRSNPFAKIKWVGTRRQWELFWMRASGKWVSYEPSPCAAAIAELFDEIQNDPHGCFFG